MHKMIHRLLICFLVTMVITMTGCSVAADGEWIALFDGRTLEGWSVHSGIAKYRVEDGAIVGTSVPNTGNTFLCTDRNFGDFILEFEVLLHDNELNSGVQFRSQIAESELIYWFRNGDGTPRPQVIHPDRVYGYQVEIAKADNGSSGGVYDEARRAFMLSRPEEGSIASTAFKDGEWNQYRVECRGDAIKTWVNGILCADFKDAMTARGIIGLQVHDVGDDPTPYQVRWRNIRIKIL